MINGNEHKLGRILASDKEGTLIKEIIIILVPTSTQNPQGATYSENDSTASC